MIYLKLVPIIVLLAVGVFIALGPGRAWLIKSQSVFMESTKRIVSTNGRNGSDVLGEAFSPIEETSNSVEEAVAAITSFPRNQIEAIRAQICNPQ